MMPCLFPPLALHTKRKTGPPKNDSPDKHSHFMKKQRSKTAHTRFPALSSLPERFRPYGPYTFGTHF